MGEESLITAVLSSKGNSGGEVSIDEQGAEAEKREGVAAEERERKVQPFY
jgi:hypothetical protein